MNTTSAPTAQMVSRQLRKKGWNISPSARRHRFEGIFVSGAGSISICFSFDSAHERTKHLDEMTQDLVDLGYVVTQRVNEDTAFLYVTKEFVITGIDENAKAVKRTVGSMGVVNTIARYAIRNNWTDVAVHDNLGVDVTFDVPAFQE